MAGGALAVKDPSERSAQQEIVGSEVERRYHL
jgi:hypothetical protein